MAAAPSSRHKIARASSSGIIQAVFIRHPPDADFVEAEIAVFGGFWQCQTLDRGSHALKPVTIAPRALEMLQTVWKVGPCGFRCRAWRGRIQHDTHFWSRSLADVFVAGGGR